MSEPVYQPHEQRVIAEKAELEVKIAALQAFTLSPRMKALDPVDQADLDAQLWAMREYVAILGHRIARFVPVAAELPAHPIDASKLLSSAGVEVRS